MERNRALQWIQLVLSSLQYVYYVYNNHHTAWRKLSRLLKFHIVILLTEEKFIWG